MDRVAAWSLLAMFLAVSVPWLLHARSMSLAGPARAALAFLLVYQLLAMLTDRVRGTRSLLAGLIALQSSLLVFLALLWGALGGMASPALLIAFGIPVGAAGILLGRAASLGGSVVSAAAVTAVALGQSLPLRWYVSPTGLPGGESLASLAGVIDGTGAGGRGDPSRDFGLLAAFLVLLPAWALVSHGAGELAERLARRAQHLVTGDDGLGTAALMSLRQTIVVVDEEGVVLRPSRGFVTQMLLHGQPLAGRNLFDLLEFDDPQAVRQLLAEGGSIEFGLYSVGGEARVALLEGHRFRRRGADYTWLCFFDRTELWWLTTALDASDDATLVIGVDGRLRYASAGARVLLGDLYSGLEADTALEPFGLAGWWRLSAPAERRIEVGGRACRCRSAPLLLSDARAGEQAWLVTFRYEAELQG